DESRRPRGRARPGGHPDRRAPLCRRPVRHRLGGRRRRVERPAAGRVRHPAARRPAQVPGGPGRPGLAVDVGLRAPLRRRRAARTRVREPGPGRPRRVPRRLRAGPGRGRAAPRRCRSGGAGHDRAGRVEGGGPGRRRPGRRLDHRPGSRGPLGGDRRRLPGARRRPCSRGRPRRPCRSRPGGAGARISLHQRPGRGRGPVAARRVGRHSRPQGLRVQSPAPTSGDRGVRRGRPRPRSAGPWVGRRRGPVPPRLAPGGPSRRRVRPATGGPPRRDGSRPGSAGGRARGTTTRL
ncbi:MAG: FIG002813: LPPG:FO 2-phospho-L-lactate transferase like, CofD-like, partial [uncultured Acidimicrobiales bacterium]